MGEGIHAMVDLTFFFRKKLYTVGCATMCFKSEVILMMGFAFSMKQMHFCFQWFNYLVIVCSKSLSEPPILDPVLPAKDFCFGHPGKKTITNKQTRLVKLILIGQKIRENYQNILINFKYFENYLDNTGSQTLSGTHLEGFFMITVYRHVHPEIPKKLKN